MKKRKGGDPNNTDKRDPAPVSPDGSSPNEGSVTQICTEFRDQGLRDHGLDMSDIFLHALGTLGVRDSRAGTHTKSKAHGPVSPVHATSLSTGARSHQFHFTDGQSEA